MLQPAPAQPATPVPGTLYVYCPNALANELRSAVHSLYSGVCLLEFSSDGQTVFGVSDVPYPVEQARYALANVCRLYWGRHWVCWSWVPPSGAEVLPGGIISVKCELRFAGIVQQEMLRCFPGQFLYEFRTPDGWVSYDVDAPCPDQQGRQQLEELLLGVRYRTAFQGYVSWHWRSWFDEESQ
jgi:hypothetical protein